MLLPRTMRCIVAPTPGAPEALTLIERPLPLPGPNEVLVKVTAAGVSRPDTLQRKGLYPPPPGVTDVLGLEVAGEIAAVGASVSGWRTGEPVAALVAGGGYADYCTVPVPQLLPLPEGWSCVEAAALPENLCTVWDNLFTRGRLAAGESVLIHGGTSGIGSLAIQLARETGARVATTAGSEAKCALASRLGAELAINYRERPFAAAVHDWSARGVDVVLDIVGADYIGENLGVLALDGRLVVLANLGDAPAAVDLWVLLRKRLTIIASSLRARTVEQKGAIVADLRARVWPLLAQRRIDPVVDQVYPLERAALAHARLEASAHLGKIVLTTG